VFKEVINHEGTKSRRMHEDPSFVIPSRLRAFVVDFFRWATSTWAVTRQEAKDFYFLAGSKSRVPAALEMTITARTASK
jgi:hypothetical protein